MMATAAAEQIKVPLLARRIGADVVFSPANYGPLSLANQVLLLRNAPTVIDVEKRLGKVLYWRAVERATAMSLRRARRAIAVSNYARDLFIKLVPGAESKIDVVPHGVAEIFRAEAIRQDREDFVLAVSDIYVQKNFEVLLRAFARLTKGRPGLKLFIAGRPIDGGYLSRLRDIAKTNGVTDHVKFLGGVETAELADLYRRCGIFVFPSTVETFGNPLLEAMASACPIICSNAAAMPEIAGDGALFFEPHDDARLAEQIETLLGDPAMARTMAEKASARARRFTWGETVRRTAAILKSVARPG
jgi:glycosyltransferase involved in cell wall biosynthesis